ncbi:hypothetical protein QUA42_02650 [Microcoleus sp. Pol11C2]|uniref:hypothetical protein n=1 Tax=Microcoleus sp. Pol11C2 TaxID=3055389 RepID=UPI002FD30299
MPLHNPITEPQVPQAIARDTEATAAAAAATAAHEAATDPHPQYLTQTEGDARYQLALPVTVVQQSVAAPAQISILANTWFDVGTFNNVNSGSSDSLFAMSLYVQYTSGGTTQDYWQYAGAAVISPVWWKAGGAELVKYIDMEGHNSVDFALSFRLGIDGQGGRMVQLYFPLNLIARLVRASFVRLRY